ncbi:MAG: FAD-dependent oxidoreductase [Alphaproteobacteria bacterium]
MKTHARVVVIGGGVAGSALLYHLTRLGWRDVVLVEKGELTAGSTWHAAGNTPHYSTGYSTTRLYLESTRFYEQFMRETGEDVGWHKCGGIRLAINANHMEEHRRACAKARYLGMRMEMVGPNQAKDLLPYMEVDGIVGAAWTQDDGYIDPSSITNALARQARANGAEIYRHTRVTGTVRANGHWRVETEKGPITCEIVVNSAGLWGREVAAMVGYHPPMVPMERQYLVTETVEGLKALGRELPILRDISAPLYMRQERESLLLGLFDQEPVFWAADRTPDGFEQELLVPDLDRVSHAFEKAVARVPVLGKLGVKRVINGPLMRSPDGNPLIGPVPGLANYYMNGGYFAGFGLSGGLTARLAEWIVGGEPEIDLTAFDVKRFGAYATIPYTMDATRGAYVHEFSVAYPQEEPHGARRARTSAIYDRLKGEGAVFGVRNGWEVPNWFAPKGAPAEERPSYGRANWFPHVAAECRAVATAAGLLDLSSLAKFEIRGKGAAPWLDGLIANRLPERDGKIVGAPLLTKKGGIAAFAALARLSAERFYLTGSALSEQHLDDHLRRAARDGIEIDNVTAARAALFLVGPKARDALAAATGKHVSDSTLPPFGVCDFTVGFAPVSVLRLSSIGGLGFEIHCEAAHLFAVYNALKECGAAHGLVDIGMRAFESMRIERGLPRWGMDFGPATRPRSIGFDRFVKPAKGEFVGRDAVTASTAPSDVLVTLRLEEGGPEADPSGLEIVHDGEAQVGLVTSGAFGHRIGARIALAFVKSTHAKPGTRLAVELLGARVSARVVEAPLA